MNSAVTVIMSSRDYILTIYDMVITRHQFLVLIQCDGICVIRRLYFDNICLACLSHQKDLHATVETKSYGGVNKWSRIHDVHDTYQDGE